MRLDETRPQDLEARRGERRFSRSFETVDAGLVFIGRVRSPWLSRGDCPKNLRQARERGLGAEIRLDPPFEEALVGLESGNFIQLLTFLDRTVRDLALQHPRHAEAPRGTFALRSPVRPNPIGLHLVRILAIVPTSGLIGIDAIDVLDGTPVLDIKPYLPSVDAPPEERPT